MKFNKLVVLILIALSATFGSSLYAASISVIPTSPTANNFIVANIVGEYGMAGYIFEGSQLFIDPGNTVNIDLFIDAPEIGATVLTPFSYEIAVGFLDSGIYSISADFYFDSILGNTVSNTFTVSSVPIPPAVWLFFSGILSIFSFGLFKKKA